MVTFLGGVVATETLTADGEVLATAVRGLWQGEGGEGEEETAGVGARHHYVGARGRSAKWAGGGDGETDLCE